MSLIEKKKLASSDKPTKVAKSSQNLRIIL